MQRDRTIFGLRWTLIFSLAAKFAIFFVGVAIVGFTSTRTELGSCSSSSIPFPVFASPLGNLEAYTDYRDLYLKCLVNPFLSGSNAYHLPIVYNYPPLFLYTLAVFALVTVVWFPAIALVLFDALTVIPIYLIAKDYLFPGKSKVAFAIAMIWVFNPINLFYNDLMWLNPGPTTFFLMLGILFFLRQKWALSSIVLAISTGFKQTTVVLIPILLVIMWKTIGITKKSIAFLTLYISSLIIISTPYIFNDAQGYLWSLQIPLLGNPPGAGPSTPSTFVYNLSQPTRLTTFLGLIKVVNLQSVAVASYSYLNYIFAICYVVLILHLYFTKRKLTNSDYLVYLITALLLFFTFFGRGVYKYYFAGVTPLAIPLYSSKRKAIIFEAFSLVLLFIPREVTPWMALLLITFVPSLLSQEQDSVVSVEGKLPPLP